MGRTESKDTPLKDILEIPLHPTNELFPMLERGTTKAEKTAVNKRITLFDIAESIRKHGMIKPIILFEGENGTVLLDGKIRRAAAKMAKVETVPVAYFLGTEEQAEQYILSINLDRTDRTVGQRAYFAATIALSENSNIQEVAAEAGASIPLTERIYLDLVALQKSQALIDGYEWAAEEQEKLEGEAKAELELFKTVDDKEGIRRAAIAINQATQEKADLREKATKEKEIIARVLYRIARIRDGASYEGVYGRLKK